MPTSKSRWTVIKEGDYYVIPYMITGKYGISIFKLFS